MEQHNQDGSQITYHEPKPEVKKSSTVTEQPLVGKIADQIGTGSNAKDSFIWMTITWSFYISTGLSVLVFAKSVCLPSEGFDFMTSIKDIWSIFTPIITLALGYAFGKGQ
ncbi:hypothetical protein ACEZNU_004517 [Vibrio parahaemolyticus]